MKAKIKWLKDISEKDKGLVYQLFDWKQQEKWDLNRIYPSGGRSLYFKLSQPIESNKTEFKFLKIKGHHYINRKNGKMHPSEAKEYTGEGGGNPLNIKVIRKNPSVPEGIIEHKKNYGDYTLYFMKTYKRPNGCMLLEEVINEAKIQNHLLENDCLSPLSVGIAEYDKKFDNKKLGAHIMAIPIRDVRIGDIMELCVNEKKSSPKYKTKMISLAVELHFNGLKRLHEKNVAHMYAHFANSVVNLKSKSDYLFYCDFENSVLLREKDKEYNKLYKAIDLTEAFCKIYLLKRDLEKTKKITGNFFHDAIKGYGLPDKEKEIEFILGEKSFGSFINFCKADFDMANRFKEIIK